MTTSLPSTPRLDVDTVAGVLLEPLQGEGGVMVPSSDYLGAVRALCTERNALLMLDEVQTGLGRTGHWFAFLAQGLRPDVVTMAKALGNGMPVGACWARAEVAAAFGPGDHGSTFGGQPLAMAAVRATLAVMEAEDVCGRAQRAGARLRAGLAAFARRRVGPWRRAAPGRPAGRAHGQGDRGGGARGGAAGQPGASRRDPGGAAPAGERRGDRRCPRHLARSWRPRPPARPRPRRAGRRRTDTVPDLFDVDDLWPDDYDRVLELATSDDASARCSPG